MDETDVLVVGAGPAGSTAAAELARRGHSVVVLEEHGRVGHPVQCAGLVSRRVLDLAGSERFVLGAVRGASVYGPDRARVSFRAREARAFVIDRAGLDVALSERAARLGARFRTGVRFDGIERPSPGRLVARVTGPSGENGEIGCRLVVGADGVASAVARAFRIRRNVEILPAFEAEMSRSPGDPEEVGVYLGRTIAPGLFGWWIPDLSGGARVGVAAIADGTTARTYFERLLRRIEKLHGWQLASPSSYIVSGIPIGKLPRTSGEGVVLVGDAAAQVKPLSGGGIYTGMRCAQIAAETADRALSDGDLGAAALARYDVAWTRELGPEFDRALYLRRLFLRLDDADLERVVAALDRAELKETITAFGDIDFPTGVVRQVLRRSPSLVRLFPKVLGALRAASVPRAPELEPGPRRQAR